MSKGERRKSKAEEKVGLGHYPSRKLHFEEYQIPPYTQEHLRALLLEYIAHEQFECPVHHIKIYNRIRSFYQNFQNADIYMKDLNVPAVLIELQKNHCLQLSEGALGTQLVTIMERYNPRRIQEEAERFRRDRPIVPPPEPGIFSQQQKNSQFKNKEADLIVESFLNAPSIYSSDPQADIHQQLDTMKTYQKKLELEQFKNEKNIDFCEHCTRDRCQKAKGHAKCIKKHFRAIITQNTDESYGNCPHLNACHNAECKLIHYIEEDQQHENAQEKIIYRERVIKAQWINCDLRYFDFKILGKFNVIMADPPWDIHMLLPYGTLKDKELLNLRVDILQDSGLIFLWVTGRAMELGRQCLLKWGYKRVDEIVWIKTNQIHRLIITGKTGHWLNHTKEHCLVGIKGDPVINKKLDCDVIVSNVRETSRKPDEIYAAIERMIPGGKKIELFGRPDNCMPGWLTLGNQLVDVRLKDREIISRYQKVYPTHDLSEAKMERNLQEMVNQDNLNKIYNNHIHKNPT